MPRDLTQELSEQAESCALPTWEPQPGETLVGTIAGYMSKTTKHGPARQAIVEREDGSGRIIVWITAAVLKSAFEEQRPRRGDRVAIRYNGRHPTKAYHLYALIVDRDGQAEAPAPAPVRPASRTPYAAATVSRGPERDNFDPFDEGPGR
jgi:hypothetical protein